MPILKNKWYINKLFINNFKPFAYKIPIVEISFQNAEEQLASYTMLSGPNGYGKTTLFQAIEFVIMGKIDIFVVKDKTRNYSEHIAVNELGKESLIAIEFVDIEGNKATVIRYNKKAEACTEVECLNEWKGYEVFLICELFNYQKFKQELASGKLIPTTNNEIQKLFCINKLSEWVDFNYIQQEQSNNLVFKSNTDRVNFVNMFIDRQEENYTKLLSDELTALDIQIKQLKIEIPDLKASIAIIENASIGEKPEPTVVFQDSKYIWDKLNYDNNENLVDYISTINQIKEISIHSELYLIKARIDQLDVCTKAKEKIERAIISKYFREEQRLYLSRCKAHNYYKEVMKNGLLNVQLSADYFEPDFINEIKRLKEDKLSIEAISGEEEKMFQVVQEVRGDLLKSPMVTEKVFSDTCPICGTEFNGEKLIIRIENYESKFTLIEKMLNENIINLNNSINSRLTKKNKVLENLFINTAYEEEIFISITKLQNETEGIDKFIKILDSLIGSEWFVDKINELDNSSIKKYTNELLDIILNEEKLYLEKMNMHEEKDSYKEDFYNKYPSFILDIENMPNGIENKLDSKIRHLEWLIKKKQLYQNSTNKELWMKKSKELNHCLTKKYKINTILGRITKAKNTYLEDLAKYIEIPLYIYSGKLLQTHQNNLGIFCNTGEKADQLTQFKLTTTGDNKAHDILNKFSSGQKAVLNIALILAFRKIKDNVLDVFMIDDPCQSLDDINIASLTEILCNEFETTQIIMSTHDEDTAGYMCYKYYKSGKVYRNFNIQKELYKLNA